MFECTCCGLCCKNINLIRQLDYLNNGTGRCINLQNNNLCAIYDKRPDICNVERMYDIYYKDIMTRKEYDELNAKGCQILQKMYQ